MKMGEDKNMSEDDFEIEDDLGLDALDDEEED